MDAFSLREDGLYNFYKITKITNELLLFIIHGEYQRLEKTARASWLVTHKTLIIPPTAQNLLIIIKLKLWHF